MKILHAAETIRGGVATIISHNIRFQTGSEQGASVMVLAPHDHMADLRECGEFEPIIFHRTGRDLPSLFRFVKTFIETVKGKRPDVVHLHSSFAGLMGRLSLLYLRLHGIRPRVIYCPHGWSFLMAGSAFKKRIYGLIERAMVASADKIICVSNYEIEEAKKYGIQGDKIVKVYNGIQTIKPASRVEAPKDLKIIFVGRLEYAKGFDVALKVMSRLEAKPYHLYVIGEAVHATIEPEKRSNVTYMGWQPPVEVFKSLADADLLMMPSRWEGFGLAAAEAAMQECPAIVTNCCSLPEIVLDGVTGFLVSPNDEEAIVRILESTPLSKWRAMGARAREHVLSLFSVEQMVLDTMLAYKGSKKTGSARQ